MSASTYTFF